MALATGALKKSVGTTINHMVTTASVATATFSVAADIDNAHPNTDQYLWCDVVLTYTRGAAGTAGFTVALYRRYLDVKSTNDEPIPTQANLQAELVGVKLSYNDTNPQNAVFENIWIGGRPCEFYIQNNTGQTISANWTLDIVPFTFVPQ